MCHDKYHVDPDLRAVANRLTGLQTAQGSIARERSQAVSALLLNTACCSGLLDYLEVGCSDIPSGEWMRLHVRLKSIMARFQTEALDLMRPADDDQPPF